jgi:hypothetical protein
MNQVKWYQIYGESCMFGWITFVYIALNTFRQGIKLWLSLWALWTVADPNFDDTTNGHSVLTIIWQPLVKETS